MVRGVAGGNMPHEGSRRIQWGWADELSGPWADRSARLQRPAVIGRLWLTSLRVSNALAGTEVQRSTLSDDHCNLIDSLSSALVAKL